MLTAKQLFSVLPSNCYPIIYYAGFGGQMVTRILSAHEECYWQSSWNNSHELLESPLKFPETVGGFMLCRDDWTIKDNYSKVHGGLGIYPKGNYFSLDNEIKQILHCIKTIKTNKLVWFHTHPSAINPGFKNGSLDWVACPFVYLYASESCDFLDIRDKQFKIYSRITPCQNKLAYNLDVSQLFSNNYNNFESEYLKLCAHFKLTPQINSVRAFILRYLERLLYIQQF